MLRTTLLTITLLAFSGAARANSWAEGLFDETKRDFGAVPHGQMLTHVFRVVNNTKVPVHISGVRVGCHCTTARALTYSLAPGQETGIFAQMDSGRFFGVRAVTVFVSFDQPQFEEVQLAVLADSRSEVYFSPDNLAFGKIRQGTTPTTQVLVTFIGNAQTQITTVKSESNYILPKVTELRRDGAEVVYQVSAGLRADIPEGKWYTDVWLTTNNTSLAKLRVPLTVDVDAPLPSVVPAPTPPVLAPAPTPAPTGTAVPVSITSKQVTAITLAPVKAGTEAERKITLRGAQPFRIVGVYGPDSKDLFVHPASSENSTVHVLTVTVRPTQPGQLNQSIHVQTDMQNNREIEINAQTQILP